MRKPEPVEQVDLVHAEVPSLAAAIVIIFALGVAAMWMIILATPAVPI